jgi:hypothetical protein
MASYYRTLRAPIGMDRVTMADTAINRVLDNWMTYYDVGVIAKNWLLDKDYFSNYFSMIREQFYHLSGDHDLSDADIIERAKITLPLRPDMPARRSRQR